MLHAPYSRFVPFAPRALAPLLGVLLLLGAPSLARAQSPFARGDVDGDGRLGLHDASRIFESLAGGPSLRCAKAADFDDDGALTRADAFALLAHRYEGGPAPAAPGPEPGVDPTADTLTCLSRGPGGPVADDEFRMEFEIDQAGNRGAIDLHVLVSAPRAVRTAWLRLRFDTDVVSRISATISGDLKRSDRYTGGTLLEDGGEVGVLWSTETQWALPAPERVEAFKVRLCFRSPTPIAGWDLPIEVVEAGFSVAGEEAAVRAVATLSTIRVRFGLGNFTAPGEEAHQPGCYTEIPSVDFVTCVTQSDGSVRLAWTEPVAYDSISIFQRRGSSVHFDEVPPGVGTWVDPDGLDNEYTYAIGGIIAPDRASEAVWCWAADPRGEAEFVRGDTNQDGRLSTADMMAIRDWLFNGGERPGCVDAADLDDDGKVTIVDEFLVLHHVAHLPFGSQERVIPDPGAIPEPFPEPAIDPTPEGERCLEYSVHPAEPTDDAVRLGAVEVLPGEEVDVPVYLTNSVEIDAVQLVLHYDSERLLVEPGTETLRYDDTFFTPFIEQHFFTTPTGFFTWDKPISMVETYPADGVLTAVIVPSVVQRGYFEIPPGDDTLVAKLRVKVSADVQPGTILTLAPPEGEAGYGPLGLRNELTSFGVGRYATFLPATVEGEMRIGIDGDISFFVRGDANGDRKIDISDPVAVLNYLFLSGDAPACPDAADADDSGSLEITDAVVILGHLFLGTSAISAPWPEAGPDPRPDFLDPCRES